ncbi:GAF domain-containing sensor histidine kinase [Pseudoxanthomonas sp. JBR18]|uniref:GAF domain-containing sensor histidine kinase n=1 Tax=Pseudoxanthomonas sp. JBR18 TaxID=2969308 RepID=UPI002304EB08|nr:GAF domain-containing sensor histidine kinase [Pseudoxanthomonas sp. JBR18]WCE04861.1 GAF domain-containing sensor histidine kinase [Pseudoxanthomonas sp. JBR18]
MHHRPAPKLPAALERRRLDALYRYDVLDTAPEAAFDDITQIAALFCGTPMALISLVEAHRQWFKSAYGLNEHETPIEGSICAHALLQDALMVVPDTCRDARFRASPLVLGAPHLRFYAGAQLRTPDGLPLGTVCVLDTKPGTLTEAQGQMLRGLARQVMTQLELRRLLATSERTSQYRAGLLASAGHDFRTPMTTVNLALDMAHRASAERLPRILAIGRAALANVESGLTRMLSSASGQNTFELNDLAPTSIGEVLDRVGQAHDWTARRQTVRLTVVGTTQIAPSDGRQLETLLGNLVANAIKYTPAGGRVLVGCRRREGALDIEVVDNGPGIAPDKIAHMYGAFRQTTRSRDGLGLGLWIVHRIATALDIGITVRSRPGRGTRFILRLPGAMRPDAPLPA